MESSHQASKIVGVLLLCGCLCLGGWAAWSQWQSVRVQRLTQRAAEPVEILVLTHPAMFFSYVPSTRKAHVRVLKAQKSQATSRQEAEKLVATQKINYSMDLRYFEPSQPQRDVFWQDFKKGLLQWRYDPRFVAKTLWAYISARSKGRTNLPVAEFVLLALEFTQLEANDFTFTFPHKSSKQKTTALLSEELPPDRAPLVVQDRPILVEVLNASGKKGLALELTQYLREKNTQGLLRVDVLQYDNYPTIQETSWIENYTGQPIQLKQLGHAIGITDEIRTGTTANVICDTRIILGKDFKMPF